MCCRINILKITRTLMEIGSCRMHGQVSQDSLYLMRNHLMDIHGLGRLKRKQTTSRPDNVWPHICTHMSDASISKTSKTGLLRNKNSITPDKYVASSLRCQQQCFVKLHCAEVAGKAAAIAYSLTERKYYSCLCTWTISKWHPMWKILIKDVDQHHSLTIFIWVALSENAKQAKILWTVAGICSNPGCQLKVHENLIQTNLKHTCPHVCTIWKIMQRNVWQDLANLQTKRLNNCTKSQRHVWMTINSNGYCADRQSFSVVLSQNGPEHATSV